MNAAASPVFATLADHFAAARPAETARQLETMESGEAAGILGQMEAARIVDLWRHLSGGFAMLTFNRLPPTQRTALLAALNRIDAAELASSLPEEERDTEFARLEPAAAEEIRQLLAYPDDTAGRVMDTHIFSLKAGATVGRAVELLRERGRSSLVSVKVVDDERRLIGQVPVRDLVFRTPDTLLSEAMTPVPVTVNPMDPRDYVVEKFEEFNVQEMPVVDLDGKVMGVIRHGELVDALRQDLSLDMQTMVGASADERALSTSWFAIRKRLPWLQINLLTAFLAASVVGVFESTIATYTALAVLLPVVAGQSGNTGAQALAVTMRGLALREIHYSQWLGVVLKETNAGFWNGVGVALTCAIGVYVWSGSVGLVLVIASSMVISMVMAGIAGALVPITLARLKQDPAVASSIILTTITDIAGFFSFLGIATLLSGLLGP